MCEQKQCCNHACNQGRACPRRVERDEPVVELLAFLASALFVAAPFAVMLVRHHG